MVYWINKSKYRAALDVRCCIMRLKNIERVSWLWNASPCACAYICTGWRLRPERDKQDGKISITYSCAEIRHSTPADATKGEPYLIYRQACESQGPENSVRRWGRGPRPFYCCGEQGNGGGGLDPRCRGGTRVGAVSHRPEPPRLHCSAASGEALQ